MSVNRESSGEFGGEFMPVSGCQLAPASHRLRIHRNSPTRLTANVAFVGSRARPNAGRATSGAIQRGLGSLQNREHCFERHALAEKHLLHCLVIGSERVDPRRGRHKAQRTGNGGGVVGPA